VAFRYITAGSHPDHDTIASFRKRFLDEIDAFFVQILQIAHQMGFKKVGIVSLDGQSRTMPVSGDGFEQAYNCQAVLDNESGLILTHRVSQSPVDRNELAQAVEALTALPEELGRPEALLADAGYFSRPNVELCDRKDITPFISFGRQQHDLALEDRWHCPPYPETEDFVALMKHRLKTPEGRKLYGRRKATIEPAFGLSKANGASLLRLQPEADTPIVRSGVNGEREIPFLSVLLIQLDTAMGLSNGLFYNAGSFGLKMARQSDRLLGFREWSRFSRICLDLLYKCIKPESKGSGSDKNNSGISPDGGMR
jgi:hypothetical protein